MRAKILYSGGCRFCRWVARVIVPRLFPQFDIIPFREPEAMALLRPVVPFKDWIGSWHYVTNDGDVAIASIVSIAMLIHSKRIDSLLVQFLYVVDEWVKNHRHILSGYVPDGPAIKKIDGKVVMIYNYGRAERFEV